MTFFMPLVMACNPFGDSERTKAMGSTEGLPKILQRAYNPGNDFLPLEKPKPGDWLAEHREPGQTFSQFTAYQFNRPDNVCRKIDLLPLGEMARDGGLDIMKDYARVYFAMDAGVLPAVPLKDELFSPRINIHTRKRQILSTDVLNSLRTKLPFDAFCILLYDIIPGCRLFGYDVGGRRYKHIHLLPPIAHRQSP